MTAIDTVRAREYPGPDAGVFLNSASWGLLPRTAIQAVVDLMRRRNHSDGFQETELGRIQHRCRAAAARIIGGQPEDIALSPNTSFGVNLAAYLLREGLPGAVVLPEGEFPANVLPFRALESAGFEVRIVPARDGLPDEEALFESVARPDTVALAISAVQFASGYGADLERLGAACAAHDVLFFVDAIQQIGVAPFDVRAAGAHIVACGGQKWLCGPWGSGFTWIRGDLRDRLPPPMVSWLGTASGADFSDMLHYRMDWRDNARRYELATLGVQDYLGLAASIEVLEEIGIDRIRAHVLSLHDRLIEWADSIPAVRLVSPRAAARRAGILTLDVPDATRVARTLAEAGVVTSVREGGVRLAPHFYTTMEQIDRVVALLDGVIES